jgi:hypothetical protein
MNKTLVFILTVTILLAGCGGSTPALSEEASSSGELAVVETESDPPTNSPEPTPTHIPEPATISASNISSISYQGTIEIPKKPSLAWPYAIFSPDSQSIVVQLESGIELLSASSLETVSYLAGFNIRGFINDGRAYGSFQGNIVLVDLDSGSVEDASSHSFSGAYTVSPSGDKLAYIASDKLLQVKNLANGQIQEIAIESSFSLNRLVFSGDSSVLIAWWELPYPNTYLRAFDTDTGERIYRQSTFTMPPTLMLDGVTLAVETLDSEVTYRDIFTNQKLSEITNILVVEGNRYFGGPFHPALNGEWITGNYWSQAGSAYFVVDTASAEVNAIKPDPYDDITHPAIISPDGSMFLLIHPQGLFELNDSEGGAGIAETDRFGLNSHLAMSPSGELVAWMEFKNINVYDWQSSNFVSQSSIEVLPAMIGGVNFVSEDTLSTEYISTDRAIHLTFWDIASGALSTSFDSLNNCSIADAGLAYNCTSFFSQGTFKANRIFSIEDPDNIFYSDNGGNIFMQASPITGQLASCERGSNSIAIRDGDTVLTRLDFPCQLFFFGELGTDLYLQDGQVVEISSGNVILELMTDEEGYAFYGDFATDYIPTFSHAHLQLEDHLAEPPRAYFGDGFIVINNRVFDESSGAMFVELSGSNEVYGVTLNEDGSSLMLLTNRGLEHWQVLQ